MPFISCNNVDLYYEIHGSGPPLMLIAGLASDSQSWLPLVPFLSSRFTVIIPDNRGVGRSTQECEITIPLMADDCAALLRHLGIGRAHLLGHSMGGMVAADMAARHPYSAATLTLVATASRNLPRNNIMFQDWATLYESKELRSAFYRNIFAWILTDRFFNDPKQLEAALIYLINYPWSQTPASFRRQTAAIAAHNGTETLVYISCPTLVMAGEHDILMPLQCSAALAKGIKSSELAIIKDAAHSLHSEQPERLAEQLTAFLLKHPL